MISLSVIKGKVQTYIDSYLCDIFIWTSITAECCKVYYWLMSDWQYLVQQLISLILTKPHSMPVWISDRKNELTCPPPASNSIFRFVPAEKCKCLHSSCQSYDFYNFPFFYSLGVNFLESLLKNRNALYKSKPQRTECKFRLTAEIKEKIFQKLIAMIFLKYNNVSCNNTFILNSYCIFLSNFREKENW